MLRKIGENYKKLMYKWKELLEIIKLSYIGVLIILSCVFFTTNFLFENQDFALISNLIRYFLIYLSVLCLWLSFVIWFYKFIIKNNFKLFNNIRLSQIVRGIFVLLFHLISILTAVFLMPIFLMINIYDYMISMRAKSYNNLITVGIFIIFDLYICLVFLPVLSVLSVFVCNIVCQQLMAFNLHYDFVAMSYFTNLSLLKILNDIILFFLVKCFKLFKTKRCTKQNLSKEDLEYSITYFKNTNKRLQIFILVILLILTLLGVFTIDMVEYQSQFLNVLTVYTVIMLYIDKRKEIK